MFFLLSNAGACDCARGEACRTIRRWLSPYARPYGLWGVFYQAFILEGSGRSARKPAGCTDLLSQDRQRVRNRIRAVSFSAQYI